MTAPVRPPYPDTDANAIPLDLRTHNQFVAWRWEWREGKDDKPGKWTKVLVNPRTGRNAKSNDPATWGSFNDAVDHAIRHNLGIGYVFHASDPFTGIDFDDCLDPETDEVDPVALDRIRALDSYTEISPSGAGVKVIVRAKLPPGRRRIGKVEMYDDRRFFTLTGRCFPGSPATIEDRQDAVDQLHTDLFPAPETTPATRSISLTLDDHELRDKVRSARNGAKFDRLNAGDTSEYGNDNSAADLAFVSMLTFYTDDSNQIDRIVRNSGLYRPKWDRDDYRRRTIEKALQRTAFYDPTPRSSAPVNAPQTATSDASAAQPTNEATVSDEFVGSTDGEACVAELARIAALEQQLAAMTAERDQLQAEFTELSRRHANMTQLLMNPNLTPTEAIAAVLVISEIERKQAAGKLMSDGRCPIYLDDIAKAYTHREMILDPETGEQALDPETGKPIVVKTVVDKPRLSRATISRALDKFDEWGMIEKTVITPQEQPLERRGKTPKTELYVRPMHQTTRETMRVMAEYNPTRIDPETGREKRHGGSLPKDQRPFRCESHPDAGVIIKTEAWCSDCGDFLGTISTETVNADAPFQDETREIPSTAPVEDVPTGNNLKRGGLRSHPHRAPAPIHDETPLTNDLCRDCRRPLRSPEERVFGRHDYACAAGVAIAAGGAD